MTKFKSYEEAVNHLDEVDQGDFSQLSLARKTDGWTVAHQLALNSKLKKKHITPEILKLKSNKGMPVIYLLPTEDTISEKFMTIDILLLLDHRGRYVYEYLPKYKNLKLSSANNVVDLYMLAMTKYSYPKISYEKFKELVDKYGLDKVKQTVKLTGKKND